MIGAILKQIINEDLNALQFTSTMNHTLSDILSVYMVIHVYQLFLYRLCFRNKHIMNEMKSIACRIK